VFLSAYSTAKNRGVAEKQAPRFAKKGVRGGSAADHGKIIMQSGRCHNKNTEEKEKQQRGHTTGLESNT